MSGFPSSLHRQPRALAFATAVGVLIAACSSSGSVESPTGTTEPATPPTTTASELTEAPTTTAAEPVPSTSTTTTDPVATEPSALDSWVAAQVEAGRHTTYVIRDDSTTARILAAHNGQFLEPEAVVLLEDGTLVDLPFDGQEALVFNLQIYGLDDRVSLFHAAGNQASLWVLDDELAWSEVEDLGFDSVPSDTHNWWSSNVDGSLLIGAAVWVERGDGVHIPDTAAQHGVVVSPDLTVADVADAPPGIPMSWTVVSGSHALLMGIDSAAGATETLLQPWAYDTATNAWALVPEPDWPGYEGGIWIAPHEFGDAYLEVNTPRGVVKLTPDGSIGLYDPVDRTWQRLEDAPFAMPIPSAAAVGDDYLFVLPTRPPWAPEEFGVAGVIDMPTGTWSTTQLFPSDTTGDDYRWDVRSDGTKALAAPHSDVDGVTDGPQFVFDATTAEWTDATPDDIKLWHQLATTLPTQDVPTLVAG